MKGLLVSILGLGLILKSTSEVFVGHEDACVATLLEGLSEALATSPAMLPQDYIDTLEEGWVACGQDKEELDAFLANPKLPSDDGDEDAGAYDENAVDGDDGNRALYVWKCTSNGQLCSSILGALGCDLECCSREFHQYKSTLKGVCDCWDVKKHGGLSHVYVVKSHCQRGCCSPYNKCKGVLGGTDPDTGKYQFLPGYICA
jgi:hypothetical protein